MYRKLFSLSILVLLLMSLAVQSKAQDTLYVEKYGNMFAVKGFVYNYGLAFRNHRQSFRYIPDLHSGVGVGVWFKYFPFDICYRKEIDIFGREDYHRIKTTDMQLRGYNKYFAGDIFIQRYTGFYRNIKNGLQIPPVIFSNLPYNPDLRVAQFDMVGKYIFNHERFSYKAGFTANERQLISSGSVTAGAALYYLRIDSDSLLVRDSESSLKSCSVGFNGGYAYNFVLDTHSVLFVSGSLGINASNLVLRSSRDYGVRLQPVLHLKGAFWHNCRKWSFGITGTFNIIHHVLDDDLKVYVHTRRGELVAIRRIWMPSKKNESNIL